MTILREGVEVILVLTMLIALAAKTGQPGAMRAIAWGVGLAVVASRRRPSGSTCWSPRRRGGPASCSRGGDARGGGRPVLRQLLADLAERVAALARFLKRQAQRGVELGRAWHAAP